MTERLRQWHFQLLVRRGREIEESCRGGPNAVAAFVDERKRWLDHFLKDHEGKLDNRLETMATKPSDGATWLHDPPTLYSSNSATLGEVFKAYEQLRMEHQYNYAVCKLLTSSDKPFWQFLQWPPAVQMAALSGTGSFCFIAALMCSAVLAYGHAFGIAEKVELYVRTATIAIALIGAALRA